MGSDYFDFSVNNISTTGITHTKNFDFLNVFPTTVTSSLTILLNSIEPNDLEIAFYDMNGKQLKTDFYKNIVGEFIKNENTGALAKGIYFIKIKAGDEVMQKKFVKM
jgi:type IX secretion system substrate protein